MENRVFDFFISRVEVGFDNLLRELAIGNIIICSHTPQLQILKDITRRVLRTPTMRKGSRWRRQSR